MEALSSSEALHALCKAEPNRPYKHGLDKIIGGVFLWGLVFSGGYLGLREKEAILGFMKNADLIGRIGIGVVCAGATGASLASLFGGASLLARGLYSLVAQAIPGGNEKRKVVYRDGSFTDKTCFIDKKFGDVISAIDDVSELSKGLRGRVFLNGFKATRKVYSKEIGNLSGEENIIINGELKGKPITALLRTNDPEQIWYLKKNAKPDSGFLWYILGYFD